MPCTLAQCHRKASAKEMDFLSKLGNAPYGA
jgi:hypothetical protein